MNADDVGTGKLKRVEIFFEDCFERLKDEAGICVRGRKGGWERGEQDKSGNVVIWAG